MTQAQIDRILEAACDICAYPLMSDADELPHYCEECPVEAAIRAATEPEAPDVAPF